MPTIEIGRPPGGGGGGGLLPLLPGIAFIALGVLVLLMPELLRFMVAGALMLFGLTLLGIGWRIRRGSAAGQFMATMQNRFGPGP